MSSYLIGRFVDPVFGLATGVMAYYLWEKDPRNSAERPEGRSLHELVRRRINSIPPPDSLLVSSEATQRSVFRVPN